MHTKHQVKRKNIVIRTRYNIIFKNITSFNNLIRMDCFSKHPNWVNRAGSLIWIYLITILWYNTSTCILKKRFDIFPLQYLLHVFKFVDRSHECHKIKFIKLRLWKLQKWALEENRLVHILRRRILWKTRTLDEEKRNSCTHWVFFWKNFKADEKMSEFTRFYAVHPVHPEK